VARWGLASIVDDASLCVAELSANAVLHTRKPFSVSVRRTVGGVRLDVVDRLTTLLPAPVPRFGSASDISNASATGRGLHIVAALAGRWGAFTADGAKTVWAELDESGPPASPSAPEMGDAAAYVPGPTAVQVRYLQLPVRAAVASGVQVEEVIRVLQLRAASADVLAPASLDQLFALVERTAHPRLAGRHAAYRAAAAGERRFDLHMVTSADSLLALEELAPLLAHAGSGIAGFAAPSPAVLALRKFLAAEAARQRSGMTPTVCTLPGD
jgi:hypothetical protein